MDEEAKHIVKQNSDFLIVGMGALMQEKFLLKVKMPAIRVSDLPVVDLSIKLPRMR